MTLDEYTFTSEQQAILDRLTEDQRFKLNNIKASFAIERMPLSAENIIDGARILLGDTTADELNAAMSASRAR